MNAQIKASCRPIAGPAAVTIAVSGTIVHPRRDMLIDDGGNIAHAASASGFTANMTKHRADAGTIPPGAERGSHIAVGQNIA
jgi:hypothetical protein